MIFESHIACIVFIIIPIIIYLHFKKGKPAGLQFSSVTQAQKAGRSFKQKFLIIPLIIRILVIIFLTIALARPKFGKEEVKDVSKGVAIYMVLDRSSSMGTEMDYEGEHLNRLEVVKKVFKLFIDGNKKDLAGRPSDLIGIITFARYADTICPLTLSHGALNAFLKNIQLVKRRSEDGTAIGDALALAAARLKTAEETYLKQREKKGKHYKIKSKVIILLTDGQSNCGKYTPMEAAKLAKDWNIKIYTVGIGSSDGYRVVSTPFGKYKVPTSSDVDTTTLHAVAQKSLGAFWQAGNAEGLKKAYKEIDALEKTEMESVKYVDYKEAFTGFALTAFILLCIEILLSCTLLRRTP